MLDNCQASRDLLKGIRLEPLIQSAPLDVFSRYICQHGTLQRIPQTAITILKSNILPLSAKLRVLADLWKKPLPGEPSVRDWAEYRFGRHLYPFVDAALTGTFSGDPDRIKIDAIMPGIRKLERQHGSVILGLLKKHSARNGRGGNKLPAMINFPEGMGQLIAALIANLLIRCDLIFEHEINSFRRHGNLWEINGPDDNLYCNNLVLALPTNTSLQIASRNRGISPPPLPSLPEARIVNVALGYPDEGQLPPGFGYLAPEQEKRFALGALFSSNMFPGRTPPGHILLEVLIGGRRHPERLALDDETLVNMVLQDITQLLPLSREPVFCKVFRSSSGIPQLEDGYIQLLEWQKQVMVDNPGLHICGFGWGGIGINDMITEARHTAETILAGSAVSTLNHKPESVYF
ncbi:hypothetical protein GF1_18250 [Desulfolithobacter dissulfuricans]|uniref:Coproporphyrinogen III oxidase n=1 Tax=Desulfolithobacter dissulfuricans TaxID=2795293 RepID=A0A915U0X5_9BACT|nr:hypothetical protein GF1_18250 [Desulfolithobacter dissulfuricans]